MQTDLNEQRRERLGRYLQAHFGAMAPEVLQEVCAHFSWVELEAGAVLLQQGQVADAAYLSLSGRLRVYVNGADGTQRAVRELGRGEIMGEIGLYSEAPRTATVVAVRHTVLARLDKTHFYDLVQRHPQASLALTRQIIERLQTQSSSRPEAAPVMLCLLPITAHVQAATLAADLQQALAKHGRVCCIGAAEARAQALHKHGAASDAACALVLDELETQHDFVLMLADSADQGWSRLCTRHADEILLLAQASEPAHIHPIEQACLIESLQIGAPNQTLLLLHPAELKSPLGMRRWLDRRPVNGHINLRPALERDVQRLARILSHQATGLVLAGGGARGLAHLGIWKELQRRGIEIDCVGGTFNNFPVNVMREQRGVRRVIGVDLSPRSARRLTFDEIPGPWTLLLDRLRPRASRRYRLPSLVSYLLNVSILYSASRQAESRRLCDLYLNPPLPKVGLLQWNQFDAIVSQGEQHAREVLDQAEGTAAAPRARSAPPLPPRSVGAQVPVGAHFVEDVGLRRPSRQTQRLRQFRPAGKVVEHDVLCRRKSAAAIVVHLQHQLAARAIGAKFQVAA